MSVDAVSWALRVPVGGNTKVVLVGLADHANPDGTEAYPSLDTLAMYAHCHRNTVRRNLRELIDAGWVMEDGYGPRGQVKYRLAMGDTKSVPGMAPAFRGDTPGVPKGVLPGVSEPPIEPPMNRPTLVEVPPGDPVVTVFDVWAKATDRDGRTRLTPDRRRCIVRALKSHGMDDCLAAVRNIGADTWARGQNDRGTRFDDIKHALGDAERLERWRDAATAPPKMRQRSEQDEAFNAEMLRRAQAAAEAEEDRAG